MKLIRIFFSLVVLLVIVAGIAIGGLMYFVDPNKLRPVIVERVMQKTGYQLAIYGKLTWSFYPRLGIKIDRMTLAAPTEPEPFLDMRNITIATELLDLVRGNKDLQGDLSIDEVHLANMQAQNARVMLHWQGGTLTLQPITADLYNGTLQGVAHGSSLTTIPQWDWKLQLSKIDMQPLLRDANRGDTKLNITGTGEVTVNASTKGISREQVINNLNGKSDFNLQNGAVTGIDLNYFVKTADALMNKQEVTSPTNLNRTEFAQFSGSADIKDGVATTNNILLNSPAFLAKAQGNFRILEQSIDLSLQVAPQDTARTKWEVPVLITGDLRQPTVRLDTMGLEKYVAKQELSKVKEKVREQIKERVPGKTGEFLQNLLGS